MTEARRILQTKLNILAVLRFHHLPEIEVLTTQVDRLTAVVPPGFATLLPTHGFDDWRFYENHGLTAVASWRECCPVYSCQAVEHSTGVWEFDIDYVNPSPAEGVALTIAHGFEVFLNAFRRKRTDAFKIRRGLLKRGLFVPDATEFPDERAA